jgi:hypothetical protein
MSLLREARNNKLKKALLAKRTAMKIYLSMQVISPKYSQLLSILNFKIMMLEA